MHKSWVGDRAFRVLHNTVKNDYIVNISLQICALFLCQLLYLIFKYSLFCNLTLNFLNILLTEISQEPLKCMSSIVDDRNTQNFFEAEKNGFFIISQIPNLAQFSHVLKKNNYYFV